MTVDVLLAIVARALLAASPQVLAEILAGLDAMLQAWRRAHESADETQMRHAREDAEWRVARSRGASGVK